eukprot:m.273437 g.273437  ORF g.273437 m.273437 type:complete len:245 (+) comp19339_c0_seq15:236-970(+)
MATDPFLVVKDEVQESLSQARALFKRFEQLLEAGSADTEELDWTTKELKTSMTSIGWDLEDLAETVTIAEASPERFKLTPDDIAERKRFIENTKQVVEDMKAQVSGTRTKERIEENKRKALVGTKRSSRYDRLQDNIRSENQGFIGGQEQQQQTIMREQDTQLEEVGQTISNLKSMGRMIGDELDDQNDLLDDFDTEMDHTQSRLMQTMRKLDRALAITKDGKQSCCICLLLLVLIILIVVYVQ